VWVYRLAPCVCLFVSTGQRLSESLLGRCLDHWFRPRANFNFFAIAGEEPSPTSGSFSFGALGDCLLFGFLGGVVAAIEIIPLGPMYREMLDKNVYMK